MARIRALQTLFFEVDGLTVSAESIFSSEMPIPTKN
jgi:hypothetical protein